MESCNGGLHSIFDFLKTQSSKMSFYCVLYDLWAKLYKTSFYQISTHSKKWYTDGFMRIQRDNNFFFVPRDKHKNVIPLNLFFPATKENMKTRMNSTGPLCRPAGHKIILTSKILHWLQTRLCLFSLTIKMTVFSLWRAIFLMASQPMEWIFCKKNV